MLLGERGIGEAIYRFGHDSKAFIGRKAKRIIEMRDHLSEDGA